MKIRLLNNNDIEALEKYLYPHKAECMFILSNLRASGIEYNGLDFQGEYFGYFDKNNELIGMIVHYWNGNIMMYAQNKNILKKLIIHLKDNIKRPIEGILGIDGEFAAKNLGSKIIDNILGNVLCILYKMNLDNLSEIEIKKNFKLVSAKEIERIILTKFIKGYYIEALCELDNAILDEKIQKSLDRQLKQDNLWILLANEIPVSMIGVNARLEDIVQIGNVYTLKEHRNKGFAKEILYRSLYAEKLKGVKEVVLFADNEVAIKIYEKIGFKKIGNYYMGILQEPIKLNKANKN